MKNIKSFTLVELLIVVGIIAILAGLIVAAINPELLRKKARDTNRKKDMSIISEALGHYYSDNNSYPSSANYTALSSSSGPLSSYLKNIPVPNPSGYYCYSSPVGNQDYTLCTQLENTSETNTGANPCTGIGTPYYCVTNPF